MTVSIGSFYDDESPPHCRNVAPNCPSISLTARRKPSTEAALTSSIEASAARRAMALNGGCMIVAQDEGAAVGQERLRV
jgi:hypothetical protein